MAALSDVRRIALALPETVEDESGMAFAVMNKGKRKGFAWVWLERVHPKKGRVPNPAVIAIRVSSLEEKDMLLAAYPEECFTEPHYNGYPAVLVRLAAAEPGDLEAWLTNAWRCQAPPALVKQFEARGGKTPTA